MRPRWTPTKILYAKHGTNQRLSPYALAVSIAIICVFGWAVIEGIRVLWEDVACRLG